MCISRLLVLKLVLTIMYFFFFQAEDGIRDHAQSRGLGDVYKRQQKIYIKDEMSQNSQLLKDKINNLIKLYADTDLDFDIFVFENKSRWEDVVRFFKSRINEIKDFIANQTLKADSLQQNNKKQVIAEKEKNENSTENCQSFDNQIQWKIL
eukprot:TRINITY_DN32333_c0_g1_i1.p2 TRINITY_DN32333_c0_g1~~TRINITY_DN32333_c0_g1_i1.p2  ORF type:complete len:151 (-),score=29.90 TRINITY_DN32333_c0_g1_i1:1-453(-)